MKITQQAVGKLSNITQSTVSWLSNGNFINALDSAGQLELEALSADVLPKIFETPPSPDNPAPGPPTPVEIIERVVMVAEAYGEELVLGAIASTSPDVQIKFISTLLSLLPEEAIFEMSKVMI